MGKKQLNYAKASDALQAVSNPLRDLINVWALVTIFKKCLEKINIINPKRLLFTKIE